MGLETAVYINDLNPANPSALDPVPEGNNHIRMLKQVLQNTFPGLAGVYTPFPSGTKLLFAQATAPTGWTQDTTDEIDNRMLRVVKTAGGGTGGSHSPILMDVIPSHTHGVSISSANTDHVHTAWTDAQGYHDHAFGQSYGVDNGGAGGMVAGFGNLRTSGDGAHAHNIGMNGMNTNTTHTHTGTAAANEGAGNWTPKYMNLILCSKD